MSPSGPGAAEPAAALTPEARVALSRRPPPRDRVQALLESIDPGALLLRLRRLSGGISTRTFEALYASGGRREAVVLRVYVPENYDSDSDSAAREWRTLRLLESAGVTAPRPLLLDAAGRHFGAPCIVMSRLPGAPIAHPNNWPSFLRQLAAALASVHALTPESADLSHLGESQHSPSDERLAGPLTGPLAGDTLAQRAWAVLQERRPAGMLPLSLVHDDYWPGNTVWHRGRLTGIVDWGSAGLGDRRTDIAQCRVDLTLMHGAERAHQFAAAYASIAGEAAVKDLWFWDAYLSLHALASLHYFEAGYIDLGLRDEDMQARRQRLERFLEDALAQAG